MRLEFTLNFSRADFEELYFDDAWEYELKLKKRKEKLQVLVLTGIVLFLVLIYAFNTGHSLTSIVGGIIFLYTSYDYGKAYKDIQDYRMTARKYLDDLSTVSAFKLVLTDSFLSVIMDDKETIGAWTGFRTVYITKKYISLIGENSFLVPAKSLSADEYERLKKFISDRFKGDDGVLDDRTQNDVM